MKKKVVTVLLLDGSEARLLERLLENTIGRLEEASIRAKVSVPELIATREMVVSLLECIKGE